MWKPWEKSTGPRSPEGKATASQNANKGGIRPMIRQLGKLLREQENSLHELSTVDCENTATAVVAAALDGNHWAIQELVRAIDDYA